MAGLSLWLLTGPPLIPTHKARVPRLSSASHTPMTGDARLSLRAATAPFATGNAPWRPWDLLTASYSKHGRPQAGNTQLLAGTRQGRLVVVQTTGDPRTGQGQDRTGCRHPWTVMEEEDGTPCCPPCCQWEEWRPPGRAAPAGVLHPTPRTSGHAGITLDALQFADEPANGQPRQAASGSPVLTAGLQAAIHSRKMRLPRVGGRWEPPARGRALRLIPTSHRRGHSSTGGWLLDVVRTMDGCGCGCPSVDREVWMRVGCGGGPRGGPKAERAHHPASGPPASVLGEWAPTGSHGGAKHGSQAPSIHYPLSGARPSQRRHGSPH